MAVLEFHEDGSLEGLDSDWVSYRSCGSQDSMPATLGLDNMAGVFILVAIGIVLGIPVVFLEIAYKKQQEKREKQIKLAKRLASQWRHKTQVCSQLCTHYFRFHPECCEMITLSLHLFRLCSLFSFCSFV